MGQSAVQLGVQSVMGSGVREVNRERLIEQNKRLKQQVLSLAEQMGEIVGKP